MSESHDHLARDDDRRLLARMHRIPLEFAHMIQGDDYAARNEYARRMAEVLRQDDALATQVEFFRSAGKDAIDYDAWKAADDQRRQDL